MLEYKIDVIGALKSAGINTTSAKKTGLFGQDTMRKFRNLDTNISLSVLNRLCCILEMQPCDLIKYVETPEDTENIISKLCDKNSNTKDKGAEQAASALTHSLSN